MDKNFEELLKALGEAAAMPVEPEDEEEAEGEEFEGEDDAKIAAAAADSKCMTKSEAGAGADEGDEEMVDATELVKSLMDKQDAASTMLAKAIETMTATVSKQTALIKSLSDEVKALKGQGRGRKTVVSVTEKPDALIAKSHNDSGVTPQEFFAKAEKMFDDGSLTGKELNTISVCMRMGQAPDASLVAKVLKA